MKAKYTPEIINRFLFNVKEEFSEKPPEAPMPDQCKATTNEATWMLWKGEFPEAEFSSRKIGTRTYFMIS